MKNLYDVIREAVNSALTDVRATMTFMGTAMHCDILALENRVQATDTALAAIRGDILRVEDEVASKVQDVETSVHFLEARIVALEAFITPVPAPTPSEPVANAPTPLPEVPIVVADAFRNPVEPIDTFAASQNATGTDSSKQ